MIKVGIVGISGYSGLETLELLLKHPFIHLSYVSANNTEGKVAEIWPHLKGKTKLVCKKYSYTEALKHCDLMFLAVPHSTSMAITPDLLNAKIRVIDLSGDYRLKRSSVYKKWYKSTHTDSKNLRKAIYGLPELYREDIKRAKLIANPGCYPTAAILGLTPFLVSHAKKVNTIAIDAKSGSSGAGRKASRAMLFSEVNENFKAYKPLNHQHAPEIDLILSQVSGLDCNVNFVPHLLPIHRGILETIYISLNKKITLSEITTLYKRFYKTEPFVRILDKGVQPETKNVAKTNFCDIGLSLSADGKMLVITTAIDNLVKGAAGQAVQNMNIMCGFEESAGLL
ncbi:N-acetyl-gamma-glutamyl-phosphate reductase [Candidatus Omnitrophota bacterium]